MIMNLLISALILSTFALCILSLLLEAYTLETMLDQIFSLFLVSLFTLNLLYLI